jgi:hypothetical protein
VELGQNRLQMALAVLLAGTMMLSGCSNSGGSDAHKETLVSAQYAALETSWIGSPWRRCLDQGGYDTEPAQVEVTGPGVSDDADTYQQRLIVDNLVSDGPSYVALLWDSYSNDFILAVESTPDDAFNSLLDEWGCPK